MEYILIGKVANTKGIKGELKIKLYTDFPEDRFKEGNYIYIDYENEYVKVKIKKYQKYKNMILVAFEKYNNINDVIKYKNCNIYGEKNAELDLEDNEYYAKNLLGLKIFQDNILKGEVFEVKNMPQGDYLDIIEADGKHYLVPFRDEFIINVSFEDNRIDVVSMEGLL